MTAPLFAFRLRPLEEIEPWHGPDGPGLRWFGLTDGAYWLSLADPAIVGLDADISASPLYCDYQVARLFDDLTELAPYALAEVPAQLHAFFAREAGRSWHDFREAWWHRAKDSPQTDELNGLMDAAAELRRLRTLDASHMQSRPEILIWSSAGRVHIKWDVRGNAVDGAPVRGMVRGGATLTREQFIGELRDFCARLCEAMDERIRQVAQGALAPAIRIDVEQLVREQALRRKQLEHELANPRFADDWPAVVEAIGRLRDRRGADRRV